MTGIVIIGAGECGTRAAFAARNAGFDGAITLIGQEGSLPYERPPLSKPENGFALRRNICAPDAFDAVGITYRAGASASSIDLQPRHVRLSDGTNLPYGRLLLATGATPRQLTCPGAERAMVLRRVEDAQAIFAMAGRGTRAVIVGAGLIGLELAASLRGLGVQVTVLEMGARALGRAVPEALAERLVARHRAEGVVFRFDCRLDAIEATHVIVDEGEVLPCDMVIAAIGVAPDITLAHSAGLECENGICVDTQLRSNVADIYAAGDCAAIRQPYGGVRRFETWRNARDQGEVAGRNLAGAGELFAAQPWFWSDHYDLGLQVVGAVAGPASAMRILSPDSEIYFWLNGEGHLIGAAGLGPGQSVAKDIRLVEMLIAAGAQPAPDALANTMTPLKALLKQAKAA